MTTVLTYGTFDLFHVGHVRLLKRLKLLGERLIVGCSTDEFNQQKGKKTVVPFAQRAEILESCRYVDEVIPESSWEQKAADIQAHNVDIFAIGDDWAGHFDHLEDYCQVLYLPRTDGISTTGIKSFIGSQVSSELISINNELQFLSKRLSKLSVQKESSGE